HKSPSDLNTRLLRANVDTYLVVKGLSRKFNISMADALDKLITGLKPVPKLEPVAVATKPAFRVKAPVALRVSSQPVLSINGGRVGVFVIKPKGGILND
ncbi:unnamed protein product, partial [marine sediment metagenome]